MRRGGGCGARWRRHDSCTLEEQAGVAPITPHPPPTSASASASPLLCTAGLHLPADVHRDGLPHPLPLLLPRRAVPGGTAALLSLHCPVMSVMRRRLACLLRAQQQAQQQRAARSARPALTAPLVCARAPRRWRGSRRRWMWRAWRRARPAWTACSCGSRERAVPCCMHQEGSGPVAALAGPMWVCPHRGCSVHACPS